MVFYFPIKKTLHWVIIFRNKKYNFKGKASPKAARVPKLPIGR
jgi:hypothetical protein